MNDIRSQVTCDTNCYEDDPELHQFSIGTWTKIYIYFIHLFGCLNLCSKYGNKHIKDIKETIDKGEKFLEKDFNFRHIVNFTKKNAANVKLNTVLIEN